MAPTASDAPDDRIRAILSDPLLDDPASDVGRDELIWGLVAEHGWDAVLEEMLSLLLDDAGQRHWTVAATVIWRGIDLPMPAVPDRMFALVEVARPRLSKSGGCSEVRAEPHT